MTFLVATFGTVAIAAYGVVTNIFMFVLIPAMGLSMATSALVGQHIGAGKIERATRISHLSSGIAFVSLTIIGLAAKDAILIIEFAKDLRAEGKSLVEATLEACHLRFRPILMTGLAFVCGVLPMVVAHGAGGASQQALGTSVMGGMIAVVILALLMVPVFFVSVQRVLAGDREKVTEAEAVGKHAPTQRAAE